MKAYRHGLSIGIERVENNFFLSLKAIGNLTHEDYETIIPMIDKALDGVEEANLKAFVDLSEFEGWELQAAWDDFKLGLKHGKEFDKVAILTNKSWLEIASKVASWFVRGQVKTFEDEFEALNWLNK